MKIITKARKWGNSLAIILPNSVTEEKKIKENDNIVIEIKNRILGGELFGKFPRKTHKSAQDIKNEIRSGW